MNKRLKMADDGMLQALIESCKNCETRQKELDDREEKLKEFEIILQTKQRLLTEEQKSNDVLRMAAKRVLHVWVDSELHKRSTVVRLREEVLALKEKRVEEKAKQIETKFWYLFELPEKNYGSKMKLSGELGNLMLNLRTELELTEEDELIKECRKLWWKVYFDRLKKAKKQNN